MKYIKCPECNGEKEIVGIFPIWSKNVQPKDRKPFIKIKCNFCEGAGIVSENMIDQRRTGKMLRNLRLSKKITLRNAAKILEIPVLDILDFENGKIRATEELISKYNSMTTNRPSCS